MGSPSLLQSFLDPIVRTDGQAGARFRLNADAVSWAVPTAIGVAMLVLSFVGWASPELESRFYFSYLVGWTFCLSVAVGALFFVTIQHITRAQWSVVVRRMPEVLAWSFPMLAVAAIPLVFGLHDLFHWTHAEVYDPASPHYDEVLAGKRAYLNLPFFGIRMVLYFAVWTYLSYRLYSLSVRQDVDPRPDIPSTLRTVSAWGIPALALTSAFASYDLVMSLDPHWFSTIFGVYFFAGSFLAVLCVMTLASLLYRRSGHLRDAITKEHYHDLGKWIFGFVIFWAYIAFSQYMLYWYGNLPEEIAWYQHRTAHGWDSVSRFLILGHFVIPFFVLLPRFTKRLLPILGLTAFGVLVMHAVDLYWMIMPVHETTWSGVHWLDVTSVVGLAAVFWGMYAYRINRHATVPENDPRLDHSLAFENQ